MEESGGFYETTVTVRNAALLKKQRILSRCFLSAAMAVMHYIILKRPVIQYIDTDYIYVYYPNSFYNKWMGGEGATSIGHFAPLFVPLLACMPFSASLSNDYSSGIINNILVSVTPAEYAAAKSVATFTGGAFLGALPYLISMALNLCTYPLLRLEKATDSSFMGLGMLFYDVWCFHPFLYCVLYLFLIALYAGTLALFGMAMGRILKKAYSIILFPTIMMYAAEHVAYAMGTTAFLPTSVFFPVQVFFSSYWAIPVWILGLMLVSAALIQWKVTGSDAL